MDGRSEHGKPGGTTGGAGSRASDRGGGAHRRLTCALLVLLLLAVPVIIEASTASGQSRLVRIGAAPAPTRALSQ